MEQMSLFSVYGKKTTQQMIDEAVASGEYHIRPDKPRTRCFIEVECVDGEYIGKDPCPYNEACRFCAKHTRYMEIREELEKSGVEYFEAISRAKDILAGRVANI